MSRAVTSRRLVQTVALRAWQIKRDSVFVAGVVIPDCVAGDLAVNLPQTPERNWLRSNDRRCIRMLFVDHGPSRLVRDFLQQASQSLHDLRFGLFFQTSRARGPGGVAPEFMLFRRRDISFSSVRQFNIHGGNQRAAILQLDSRDPIHFIRNRRDSAIANPNRLQLELRRWVFVQSKLFEGIHFRPASRQPITDLSRKLLCPFQTRFIRHTSIELQCFFGHGYGDVRFMANALVSIEGYLCDRGGIGVQTNVNLWSAVVHPHAVSAGALRHESDKSGLLMIGFQ